MASRRLMACFLLAELACAGIALAQSKSIEGTYRNAALGYSITIPRGLKGITGDQDGPERGVQISLPSGGKIVVFGEPNSLQYKSPEEGVRAELTGKDCESGGREIKQALVGRLNGAKGSFSCGDHLVALFLAFRTHGGPNYWLRLDTVRAHKSEDEATLETIAASFKLIPWK